MSSMGEPQWTRREERRGLDPLGMQSTSVSQYQRLVPGISNVTLRMRYYGLYAWLTDYYAKHSGDPSVAGWQKFLRRSEALYALLTQAKTQDTGVAGSRWARRKLAATSGAWISFSIHADNESSEPQYLKQAFGAYGAAYGTQLFATGILCSVEHHDVPVPTPEIGDGLAAAFSAAIGGAGECFLKAVERGSVSRSELEELAVMVPSAIEPESLERNMYEAILFARAPDSSPSDLARSMSLRLVLRATDWLGYMPAASDIRWALYALRDSDGAEIESLSDEEMAQRFTWLAYHVNDLCHACYEALLKYVLDVLEGFPGGVALDKLLQVVVARIVRALGTEMQTFAHLYDDIALPENPWTEEKGDSEFNLINEVLQGANLSSATNAEGAVAALRLLAVLFKRITPELPALDAELKLVGESPFVQSICTELRFLQTHRDEPLPQLLHSLLKVRVIDRHLWVAIQKLRYQGDYTFLLETDNGRVRLRSKDGPVLTNPRLASSIRFLDDIHLLGPDGLTDLGRRALESV
ncbi:hypothetical protein [Cupriavidus taiwanensis]|uniref:hypothetical protein n=1 Tax=Cupriavidus taiwanensis TaxID=164546 RepID=UPI000E18702D|nr:hypothetical protein [Cupriavidus taiwanensis]SPA46767.1 conserved hypothetical protein [Cupriavidus taiwanensis]